MGCIVHWNWNMKCANFVDEEMAVISNSCGGVGGLVSWLWGGWVGGWWWWAIRSQHVGIILWKYCGFSTRNAKTSWHKGATWHQSFWPSIRQKITCDAESAAWHEDVIKWKHFPRYWPFVRGIHRSRWIPRTKASDAELWCFLWFAPE